MATASLCPSLMNASATVIKGKIAEYAYKLNCPDENLSSRKRKRILQHLGKLQKQLKLEPQISSAKEVIYDNTSIEPTVSDEITEPKIVDEFGGGSKKRKKMKMKLINKEIAEFAKRKQLNHATRKFKYALKHGLSPDVHTFTNMINACVRCHELKKGKEILSTMVSSGIAANIVTYTTLLRGFAENGEITNMVSLLYDIAETDVELNERSLNTFLRGCVRVGDVTTGWRIFCIIAGNEEGEEEEEEEEERETMIARSDILKLFSSVEPNASSYEMIISLLAQDLRVGEALEVMEYMLKRESSKQSLSAGGRGLTAGDNPCMYLALTTAAVLADDLIKASEWCTVCRQQLKNNAGAELRESMKSKFMRISNNEDEEFIVNATAESKSTKLFLAHRRQEIDLDLQLLEEYIRVETLKDVIENSAEVHPAIIGISRFLYFGYDGYGDLVDWRINNSSRRNDERTKAPYVGFFDSLRCKFGIERLLQSHFQDWKAMLLKVEALTQTYIDHDSNCINLSAIFDGMLAHPRNDEPIFSEKRSSNLPIKMEICAGNGEWVVAQAMEDREKANWVAIELRADRAYKIYSRAVLERCVSNMAILCGEAESILARVENSSVSQIFINHPEPPERSGEHKGEGKHLLTLTFFHSLRRVLRPKVESLVTIVTDNLAYAIQLAAIVGKDPRHSFISKQLKANKERILHSNVDGVLIWSGAVGRKGGHISSGVSSYFDRLWENGQKKKRWFICLTPV